MPIAATPIGQVDVALAFTLTEEPTVELLVREVTATVACAFIAHAIATNAKTGNTVRIEYLMLIVSIAFRGGIKVASNFKISMSLFAGRVLRKIRTPGNIV